MSLGQTGEHGTLFLKRTWELKIPSICLILWVSSYVFRQLLTIDDISLYFPIACSGDKFPTQIYWYLLYNLGNQSYNLQPHLIATSKELEKDSSGSHKKYNCHTLTFHVSRRMGYYFWNVFFVTVSVLLINQICTKRSICHKIKL